MRQISRISISFLLFAALLVSIEPRANGQNSKLNSDIWKSFSLTQKRYALFGFIDCHKELYPPPNTIRYGADDKTYKRIDELARNSSKPIGELILEAMKQVSPATPDIHAEHGGADDGMLWRGLIGEEKQAYVQGVFWCVHTSTGNANIAQQSIQQVVEKLDDWYIVSDDDWKDPRSNERVDVPVISALQQIGVLHLKNSTSK